MSNATGQAGTSPHDPVDQKTSIKETLTSIAIAFALAFVFRGFVVEAFLIPTGSMAPTLLGQHMRFVSPASGVDWAVSPREYGQGGPADPRPFQGSPGSPVDAVDPMTGYTISQYGVRTRGGDRIFVMKYLTSVYDPKRYDVVVFKNPNDPAQNYIKRLLGLPNEQVALIDGDIFRRDWKPGEESVANPWALDGWRVARKPERAQLATWQPLFDSEYSPLSEERDGRTFFVSPWVGVGQGETGSAWQIQGRKNYRYTGAGATRLEWNNQRRPITDSYAYNQIPPRGMLSSQFPVGDVRVSTGIRPDAAGLGVSLVIVSHKHEFRADFAPAGEGRRTLAMKMRKAGAEPGEWTTLASADNVSALDAGTVTDVDFWHVDQSLSLFVNGTRVLHAEYDWTPAQRLENALGLTLDQVMAGPADLLTREENGTQPRVWIEFEGGSFELCRTALARDLHYRADTYHPRHTLAGRPARCTHPTSTPSLGPDQFFVCGDNSPESLDARLWDVPEPWVALNDPTIGTVHRDLLIGKAFFVYFPAMYRNGKIPVPDFGRMRFIW